MESKRRGTSAAPAQASGARSAARGLARPGGLAVGETYTHEDGLKIRVDRLGLLPRVPPKSIFEEKNEYVASEAVRFEVTVTNDGDIDEAYGLHGGYPGNADAFGHEALQVLLKRAEDDRHRLVVILAGYGREMSRLLGANPGLASRFATRVDFPSYDPRELLSIARLMLAESAENVGAKADAELRRICSDVEANQWQDALGNGRFIRTLAENARAFRDLRLAEKYDKSDPPARLLTELTAGDMKAAFADIRTGHGLRPRAAIA